VRRCFTTLGFDEDAVVKPILECVAAVMQLGNINFEVSG
jgi:myosin heavy subunit